MGTDLRLLAYGSLMHPDELAGHFAASLDHAMPVRVRGYRRSFGQEPSWRTGSGDERGVLTVRPSSGDWFNAILIGGLTPEMLESLDHRERGYIRQPVATTSIEPYAADASLPADLAIALYVGRSENRNDALRPNAEYLAICLDAAARWGDEFLADFEHTTF